MRAARWSDNDRYLGPFTFAWGDYYRTFAICLRSSDDEDRATTFRLSVGRLSFLSVLPGWVIRPERKKVYPQWDEATVARLGRDWYWDITPREYSIGVSEGHLSIHYGRVTHDSSTEQQWGCFLPWTQWRHIRRSFYDLEGKHFWSEIDAETRAVNKLGGKVPGERWDIIRKWEEMCPKAVFRIRDHDGEEIEATTHIEELEWRFGTGSFKWLSLFRRPKIRRTLDISFSAETGPEKGSWKGGTMGTGIEMMPGEDHEAAFRRYCDEEHRSKYRKYKVEFIGRTFGVVGNALGSPSTLSEDGNG